MSDEGGGRLTSAASWAERLPGFLRPPVLLAQRMRGSDPVVPPWLALFFAAAALLLIPWTVWLFLSLPERPRAAHWQIAWGGFDTMLIITFVGAAYRILRRSPKGALVTSVAGTLLVVDAWFDVLTADSTDDVVIALVMAGLVELPVAAICFRTAFSIINVLEQARPYLLHAGFTLHHGRLEPPATWPDPQSPPAPPDTSAPPDPRPPPAYRAEG
ncbi:hypothetical protein [Wenjunlia tyrosinilytica]|uniref:Uncharacterized protein n=1 Tax=Wenjunlia tyrosinilytica TaxID=1544741 RepID=A0A918DX50_9ACTN|nr:hypothetical protein [Wenjunlia tyrosinilytica]GGO87844.1 hypothetical protein GCM10012280_27250 [Wenjunlia tyrosinilytica]